ncbi:HAMP domain-containing sensor histidine kinase [Streptomyces olivaceiscleroticus]|uniref:histidine kinase n=1 Tax=Streptomyces olivaceiscleroticus TaxID=68245 RepID=A0ABP3K5A6_9ACTN
MLRGLRARLVVAFLLVAAVSALTTAALTYREARNAILERSQDTAINDLRAQINSLAPDLPVPPSRADLDEFARQLDRSGKARDWDVEADYEGVPDNGSDADVAVPEELRDSVEQRHVPAFQRVERGGEPWLLIGMPVTRAHDRAPSKLSVYARLPLRAEEANVEELVSAAQRGALPVLALALIPALLAARGVLRPVRKLRQAAGRIAQGKLDTRLEVKGEDELAELSLTFNDMAAHLEENVAELRRLEANSRRFAADVSHELRTPLAAMTAVTDVLDEDAEAGTLDPDTASAVRLISQETGKLARMVEDLMEVSRFDAGAAALHAYEVDVAEAIRKTLQARAWQDRVAAELPPAGVRARLDARRLDVVVANLVGNALHHGGEPVTVRLRTPVDGRLLIEVADQGPGIDPEVLPHVFDRFYKADSARARSEGSGLGLAIAMENVRLHGGTLRAANAPDGGGAVFTIDLPLRRDEMDETDETGEVDETGEAERTGEADETDWMHTAVREPEAPVEVNEPAPPHQPNEPAASHQLDDPATPHQLDKPAAPHTAGPTSAKGITGSTESTDSRSENRPSGDTHETATPPAAGDPHPTSKPPATGEEES